MKSDTPFGDDLVRTFSWTVEIFYVNDRLPTPESNSIKKALKVRYPKAKKITVRKTF